MPAFKDLTGQRFGRLTVVAIDHKTRSGDRERYYWRCVCDCGKEHIVRTDGLTGGGVRSCGCLHRQSAIENVSRHHKHKQSGTPIYRVWQGLKKRCLNPNSKSYSRYGERGIMVCAAWQSDFQTFFEHVSKLDHFGEEGYTIDRIDNNRGYEPDNVRWVDAQTQCRNRRSNIVVEYRGKQMTLTEAAELSGIKYSCLNARFHRGDRGRRLFR